MATTDQPQVPVPGQQPSAASLPTPSGEAAPAGPPAPRRHVGVIVGSIVGGLLLLAIAFGAGGLAGGVIGWTLGTHHGGGFVIDERGWPGQDERGWQQDGDGQMQREPGQPRERHDRFEQDGGRDDLPVPVPSPTS
ncbi:hypothetical protein [Microbacterium pumilum]|uniref:Uncharacterized protein n=1 Tax=Microbacterium pumilum TaxID=344165 RepID=A0ABN2T558_9MICO